MFVERPVTALETEHRCARRDDDALDPRVDGGLDDVLRPFDSHPVSLLAVSAERQMKDVTGAVHTLAQGLPIQETHAIELHGKASGIRPAAIRPDQHAQVAMPSANQRVEKVAAHEPGAAGYDNPARRQHRSR